MTWKVRVNCCGCDSSAACNHRLTCLWWRRQGDAGCVGRWQEPAQAAAEGQAAEAFAGGRQPLWHAPAAPARLLPIVWLCDISLGVLTASVRLQGSSSAQVATRQSGCAVLSAALHATPGADCHAHQSHSSSALRVQSPSCMCEQTWCRHAKSRCAGGRITQAPVGCTSWGPRSTRRADLLRAMCLGVCLVHTKWSHHTYSPTCLTTWWCQR